MNAAPSSTWLALPDKLAPSMVSAPVVCIEKALPSGVRSSPLSSNSWLPVRLSAPPADASMKAGTVPTAYTL